MIQGRMAIVGSLVLLLLGAGAATWASDDKAGERTGVVLEASAIDSSTVEVGAWAVVVYGQGERHPVSGAWATLDTVRGYIQAVSRRSLILSLERDGEPESIAIERIQTLRLVDANRAVHPPTEPPSRRILSPLIMGGLPHSATPEVTELKEITIYVRGAHQAVVSALVAAAAAGTPVTGITEFDALSATYGLIGIYRRSRKASGFYGDRFRLTFPPAADVAAIAEAYWNLPYIKFVEPGPLPYARAWKASESLPTLGEFLRYVGNDRAVTRIPKKVGVGALTTASLGFVFLTMGETEGSDGFGVVAAASVALFFGYPVGVYLADMEESSFWMTCVGHGVGWWWAVLDAKKKRSGESEEWTSLVAIFGTPVIASELSRLVPKRFRNPNPLRWLFGIFRKPSAHVSFGLGPEPQRGLSAVVTLQF